MILPPVQQAQPGQPPRQGSSSGGAVAAGAAAGFVGGFLASQGLTRLQDVQGQRQRFDDDGATIYREPGRTIIEDPQNRYFIAHDENERFRDLGYNVQDDRDGDQYRARYTGRDGSEITTYTDDNGRLLRRMRRFPDGRTVILIDNGPPGPPPPVDQEIVDLPPPPLQIPQDRYVVEADGADEGVIYDALVAPPVAPLKQRYTLNQVRYSPDLRAHMRSVDVDTVNFPSGSWTVSPEQAGRLSAVARAINQAIGRNPQEVFLVEGYTDAVGAAVDNLSLSDRRAQSVATLLTQQFQVPPENLTTQGYGAQYLKVQTQASEAANRRVTVRRITPLLAGNGQQQ